ncbi:NADH-quinone oxidoreductase subunit C [Roseomonas hellenica]|uniref:NADH-quinone oxidoreductase subunit C n=1 Tax=Plastoroseomonas hellenica TaxID=2687306 RepID=A0ABS5EV27_9PROT|nr:NADH-quinone oxidoreductase subunit C [Plastoroseomonas hellenica]
MCRAARRPRRRWSTAFCSSRRRSAVPGASSVADPTTETPAAAPNPLLVLGEEIAKAAGAAVSSVTLACGGAELVLRVARAQWASLHAMLRDDPRFAFEQLMDICGVDWPEQPERFEVVSNLLSLSLNRRVRVITTTDGDQPVPSLSGLWPVAVWYERECWDMYGVVFAGLADMRRILTDYGFEGHPLRKDFPLTGHVELRYDENRKQVVYEPVQLAQDFRNFDFLSPWEAMTALPGDEKVHLTREDRAKIEGPR